MKRILSLIVVYLVLSAAIEARAEDYVITIKDHKFTPEELTVPADQKIEITIKNLDASSEEFESHDLNREKIVGANGEIKLHVGPLKPGKYTYYGEFHEDTAKGAIIAK